MPWAWRLPATNAPNPTGPYHLVWSRDLYQIATGLLAAGDRGAARRSVHYLFTRQQKPNGSFPQNSTAAGKEYWTGHQLDQYALPIVLAWQLGDSRRSTWQGIRKAAAAILREGPATEQERWENQGGYSPATIAAEIAGLVCAADFARDRDRNALARKYLRVADRWQRNVKKWTLTRNGPLSDRPYFLRITKDGKPNRGTTYAIGDSGPEAVDQRRVVDPSFLDLVRLGVLGPRDKAIKNTLRVVDKKISKRTPAGRFWHRFSFDGYGETAAGGDWVIQGEGTPKTYGRLWPLLTGERGEYAIAAEQPAVRYLRTMASTTTPGFMMAEQVWDGRPPTGDSGKRIGTVTRSATPLLWTHAQYVRLAWNLQRGKVTEQPSVVANRYLR
jgi:glucoamylase